MVIVKPVQCSRTNHLSMMLTIYLVTLAVFLKVSFYYNQTNYYKLFYNYVILETLKVSLAAIIMPRQTAGPDSFHFPNNINQWDTLFPIGTPIFGPGPINILTGPNILSISLALFEK